MAEELIHIDKSGKMPAVDVTFGFAQFGKYQLFIWDSLDPDLTTCFDERLAFPEHSEGESLADREKKFAKHKIQLPTKWKTCIDQAQTRNWNRSSVIRSTCLVRPTELGGR